MQGRGKVSASGHIPLAATEQVFIIRFSQDNTTIGFAGNVPAIFANRLSRQMAPQFLHGSDILFDFQQMRRETMA